MTRLITLRNLLVCLLLSGAGLALAHAELVTATPAPKSVVGALPQEVTLSFSEPVEARFSLFKVYKLEPRPEGLSGGEGETADATGGAPAELLEEEALRLNGLAGALFAEVLTARGDEAARADAGAVTADTSKEVTLALKDGLEAGDYVVMWRVLSADTHTTQGFYVFSYRPTAP